MAQIPEVSQAALKECIDKFMPIDRLSKLESIFSWIVEFREQGLKMNYSLLLKYILQKKNEKEYNEEVWRFFEPLLENSNQWKKVFDRISGDKPRKDKVRKNRGIVDAGRTTKGRGHSNIFPGIWSDPEVPFTTWGPDDLIPPPLEE